MNPEGQKAMTEEFFEDVLGLKASEEDWARYAPFIDMCIGRIVTEGANQYYDEATDTMKFEELHVDEVFRYARDEVLDLANYAAMLNARATFEGERDFARELLRTAFNLWHRIEDEKANSKAAHAGTKASRVAEHDRFTWSAGDITPVPEGSVREE